MSYEGYLQYVCHNGHRYDADCYDDGVCPFCKEDFVFSNQVNETNFESFGVIPPEEWEKLQLTPQVKEVCNLGHEHTTKHATYRVPTQKEHEAMRRFLDVDGKLVPICVPQEEG